MLTPPVLPVEPFVEPILPEPIVAPVPIVPPVVVPEPIIEPVLPEPVPIVAPVAPVIMPSPVPIAPIDLEAKKNDLENEILLGLDKIKANSVNLAAQLKNTIELHAHDVAQPMLAGLFDIAKTTSKLSNHMKDIKTTELHQAALLMANDYDSDLRSLF